MPHVIPFELQEQRTVRSQTNGQGFDQKEKESKSQFFITKQCTPRHATKASVRGPRSLEGSYASTSVGSVLPRLV